VTEQDVQRFDANEGVSPDAQGDFVRYEEHLEAVAEVRSRMSRYLIADDEGTYAAGYRDALAACCEAIDALDAWMRHEDDDGMIRIGFDKGEAVAAINALRTERQQGK